jgi:hypothetical protein
MRPGQASSRGKGRGDAGRGVIQTSAAAAGAKKRKALAQLAHARSAKRRPASAEAAEGPTANTEVRIICGSRLARLRVTAGLCGVVQVVGAKLRNEILRERGDRAVQAACATGRTWPAPPARLRATRIPLQPRQRRPRVPGGRQRLTTTRRWGLPPPPHARSRVTPAHRPPRHLPPLSHPPLRSQRSPLRSLPHAVHPGDSAAALYRQFHLTPTLRGPEFRLRESPPPAAASSASSSLTAQPRHGPPSCRESTTSPAGTCWAC